MGRWSFAFVLGIATLSASGCSGRTRGYPPLTGVTGRVTLGGAPLPDVQVLFRHRDGGRAAVGVTDTGGRFSLRYTDAAAGGAVGPNVVSFAPLPGATTVPKQLAQTRDVELKAGGNDFHFELNAQSDGVVRSPPK